LIVDLEDAISEAMERRETEFGLHPGTVGLVPQIESPTGEPSIRPPSARLDLLKQCRLGTQIKFAP
jgi:hypothetical protein